MSEFFVRRPIVAIVIAILMTLIGGVCILALPIAQYPQIAPPEIQVQTHYTGADALTIEQAVAAPIEQEMSGVDNMNYLYSINANSGDIRLIVNFDVATDPNIDHVLTQIRVSQAQSQLPADVINYGLTVKKSTTAPLMLLSLYSPRGSYDGVFLANYAYINLVDQLTRIPGIGNVQVFGAGQYAMRLWVKPDQLSKLGITVTEVVSAIQAQNAVNPAGQVGGAPAPKGQEYTYSVRAQGRLTSPEEFGDIVVDRWYSRHHRDHRGRHRAGHCGRLSVPAGMARDSDSFARSAGFLGRDFHAVPRFWILDQHTLAIWSGARHRTRGGRRDRSG